MSVGGKLAENEGPHKRFSSATWDSKTGYQNVTDEVLPMVQGSSRMEWQGSCLGSIVNREIIEIMNSSVHLTVTAPAARRPKKAKAQKRSRNRGRNGKGSSQVDPATTMAAVGTLTRTKALLLAALRVWELKHRIHDQE